MGSNIRYAPKVEKFTNTSEFSYLASYFNEHKCYTHLPKGTIQYNEFILDVRDKCLNGMTNSKGITITGIHFFYLNFIKILAKNEETGRQSKIFPRFLDIDYEYFHTVQYAKANQKNLILVKPRRLGFSYKAAAIATHEFSFFKDSKTVVSAFFGKYSENTMNMVLENLNFLNTHFSPLRKQRNPDTKDHVKARFLEKVDGSPVWKGYNSEVTQLTFKDNPFASVGLSANWFIMDEAGVFPNIVSAYNMSEPTLKVGADYIGTALIFGSAGSMEGGTQYFYEMFTNPAKYNALEFDNPDENGKPTGWFVSASKGRLGKSKITGKMMTDDDGNSLEEEAIEDLLAERERKKSSDPKAYKDVITQYPLHYKEAFLRTNSNIFPVIELQEHLARVETHKEMSECGKKIDLFFDENNKIKSRINPDLEEIIDFPLKTTDRKQGCIIIYEDPELVNGLVPNNVYIAGCDPYDQDRAENSPSLGSIFIFKRFYQANKTHNIIVAEYTGRPELADTFYENCRKLLLYYNAKCLYENQLKGLKAYFQQKHSLHLLYEQPEILKDIVKDGKVNRGYGIHMTKEVKRQCEIYLNQWLREDRVIEGDVKVMNLYSIMNQALLKELIFYDPEDGNFDRAIAFMLCIMQSKELYRIISSAQTTKKLTEIDSFFQREHFRKNKHQFNFSKNFKPI